MPDPVIARNTLTYVPVPEGEYPAVCVDVIDLGYHVNEQYASIQPKCAIVFQLLDEQGTFGKRHEIAERFTVSMSDKGRLRPFLERWRGRPYKQEQLEDGVPLDKLVGQGATITVVHNRVGERIYANVFAIRPLGKGESVIKPVGYTRAAYWQTVIDRSVPQPTPATVPDDVDALPGEEDDSSDLPF